MVFHRTAIKLIQGILLMVIYANQLSAQIAIGEWRTHLPYQFTNIVMLTDDKAFCSSTGGLFYYDLTDNSLETLSKTDGLSDNGVVAMNWSEEDQLAILAYNSANLDIIRGNQIINMPDIMKKQITGDKTVYNIYFHNSRAYLSCGFGIVVIDLNKLEITDTYYIGDNGDPLKVNQVTSDALYFYAATDEGVRKAEISNAFLIDFNSWELIDDLPDPVGKYKGTVFYSGNVFVVYEEPAGTGDQVFFNNGSWEEITGITGDDCSEIRISGNNLLFTGETGGVRIMNEEFEMVGSYTEGKPSSAIMDDTGILWIADNGQGLVKVGPGVEVKTIRPNGPFTSIAFDMESGGGLLYSVVGGITATYNNIFRAGILQTFRDQLWKYNFKTEYKDLISLAVDPKDPEHVYAASWGYGLVEYREGVPETVYDETNSTLQNAVPGSKVIRLGGLAYDEDDNLWMTNTGVPEPVSVLKSDGTWKSFRLNGILSDYPALGKVLMTKDNHLWGIIPKGGGLFAMNHNGTLENVEDDEYRLVSVADENGRTITNEVFSFAEDHNGNIWLGTNQGILVFYNPGSLFTNGSIYAREILVPRDDGTEYADALLKTQKVTSIEVDGSNRKWLGTGGGGAFLVSENGLVQLYNFNSGNSPLLSNSITDICVDGKSGEVFFGTDKGVISFRGSATEGASDYSEVKVYPNPVRETYHGPIAITGLVSESTVKITDISGNLVNELYSFGGQAIWDGTNFRGDRVATGTYLIFMGYVNRTSAGAHVAKILFIH